MRCVILTGGAVENLHWLGQQIKPQDYLICVDRGAQYATTLGLVPHLIVGDLDSLDAKTLQTMQRQGVPVQKHPAAKDDTDTTLALRAALLKKPGEIIILAALGTRFDHSLANVHLLQWGLTHQVPMVIKTEYQDISLVAPGQNVVVHGSPGQTFSLLPLTARVTGVCVTGARWPLHKATLDIAHPYGVSNCMVSPPMQITIDRGLLLLIKINQTA